MTKKCGIIVYNTHDKKYCLVHERRTEAIHNMSTHCTGTTCILTIIST